MRLNKICLLLLSCAILIAVAVGCTSSPRAVAAVPPIEAMGLLKNDFAVLIDVREESELAEGMAAPARSIPFSKIEANAPEWQAFVAEMSKGGNSGKQALFYCAKGGRAGKVAAKLVEAGLKAGNVGGFGDWKAAGLPVRNF